jgi:hypothetical protein
LKFGLTVDISKGQAIYFQVIEIENKEWLSIFTPFKVLKSNTCKLEPSPVSWNKELDANLQTMSPTESHTKSTSSFPS